MKMKGSIFKLILQVFNIHHTFSNYFIFFFKQNNISEKNSGALDSSIFI